MPDLSSIADMEDIWERTSGDPAVCIAVLDGPADLSHPCFEGADLQRVKSYWMEEIDDADVPEEFRLHAIHISSILFGQLGSEVRGIAPRCRGLNIAVGISNETLLDPIGLARAIELAADAGANIIHIATCLPSSTAKSHDILERSLKAALERNILVVAPAGNNRAECLCLPAAISGVLAVGSLTDDGAPSKFNNWGGIYDRQRVLAPGENMLGAKAGGGSFREKGTSCAAPVVTGVAALLMSLQLKEGYRLDSRKVRAAILNSTIPCKAQTSETKDDCRTGRLNIKGAEQLLFPSASRSKTSPQGSSNTRAIEPSAKLHPSARLVFAIGQIG